MQSKSSGAQLFLCNVPLQHQRANSSRTCASTAADRLGARLNLVGLS